MTVIFILRKYRHRGCLRRLRLRRDAEKRCSGDNKKEWVNESGFMPFLAICQQYFPLRRETTKKGFTQWTPCLHIPLQVIEPRSAWRVGDLTIGYLLWDCIQMHRWNKSFFSMILAINLGRPLFCEWLLGWCKIHSYMSLKRTSIVNVLT